MDKKSDLLSGILESVSKEEQSTLDKEAQELISRQPDDNSSSQGLSGLGDLGGLGLNDENTDINKTAEHKPTHKEEILQMLYEASGIDLDKVASFSEEEGGDLLYKTAQEVIEDLGSLDKLAEDLGKKAAQSFFNVIRGG